jgi:hypothetical protein
MRARASGDDAQDSATGSFYATCHGLASVGQVVIRTECGSTLPFASSPTC